MGKTAHPDVPVSGRESYEGWAHASRGGRSRMHELALCQSVVNTLVEQARIHHFDRVTAVRLEIGALSCVSAEAIEFCFAAVTRGTLADGCRLELLRIPGEAFCLDCSQVV